MSEPKTVGQILREMMQASPEERQRRQSQFTECEQSFRRGYHHAWDAAIDAIFSMLDGGMNQQDAYSMCALYVNGLAKWRTENPEMLIPPPSFNTEQMQQAWKAYREKRNKERVRQEWEA